ncbi:uncharacterized protein LOC129270764 [Lytechinus pictus]|uniref:uncharacterized protein LOC129270764 n=1 Tax=Lytechinus pictus TaxID=7653 RepID=UPI0030B9EFD2
MATNISTAAMMTTLTTMEAEGEIIFNFTGLWISIGVLGFFVVVVVLYGLITAWSGRLILPQRAEDKEPLSPDHRDNDVENGDKKTSLRTTAEAEGSQEAENAMVADEPPSYDKAVLGASSGQEAATNTDDGKLVDGTDVTVEVYEQKVDTADEIA